MKTYAVALLALLILAAGKPSLPAQDANVIEGTVTLPESRAKPPAVPRYQGKILPAAPPEPPRAVVYLEGKFPARPAAPEAPKALLTQEQFQFRPALLPIQAGTVVRFPNLDDEYHNVLSYSRARSFDLGRYRKTEEQPELRFDSPGVVKVGCEIHEHMSATILVLETPHFTTTATNGLFRLANLPSGDYTLKAWIDPKTVWSRPVTLKEGETLRVDFKEP